MAQVPVRMILTKSNSLSPAYLVPDAKKATIKSIQVSNSGANEALWVMTLTGGFEIARVNIGQNQTIVIDTAQVLSTFETLSIAVTGASATDSVTTMVSGVEY